MLTHKEINGVSIRLVDGDPVGADICHALGYKNAASKIGDNVSPENKRNELVLTAGGAQTMVVLNLAGVKEILQTASRKDPVHISVVAASFDINLDCIVPIGIEPQINSVIVRALLISNSSFNSQF